MYVLQAVLAARTALERHFDAAVVVDLDQGVAMVPLVKELRDRFGLGFCPLTDEGEPAVLPSNVMELIANVACSGPAAYIEAEMFAGVGRHACVLAGSGRCDGDVRVDDDAFNVALRFLGVRADEGKDEFDTVRLGLRRSTGAWLGREEES